MSNTSAPAVDTESAIVSMRAITKRFGALNALSDVDFDVRAGEIHGLLGENGAGKSTLMNILYGMFPPDGGEIAVGGHAVHFRSPLDAVQHGVGMVHQHFMLVPTLTVAENMVLGERSGVLVSRKRLRKAAARITEMSEQFGLEVDPHAHVWQLSVGERQRVEILRALYQDARLLILDEPTATLSPVETEQLLPRLRTLTEHGAAVVFITHHLEEVLAWADRISVLRRGKHVGTLFPHETSATGLAQLMVGREISLRDLGLAGSWRGPGSSSTDAEAEADRIALEVRGLRATGDTGEEALHGVDLNVVPGEIVAIAGVEGNGQAELEEVLFGLRPATEGSVSLSGVDITRMSPAARLRAGVGLIPSDRYRRGVIRAMSVEANLLYDRIDQPPFGSRFSIHRRPIAERARVLIDEFSIRTAGGRVAVGALSGGNAQRVVLARVLSRELKVLIAAQPTRGLDIGAMDFVWSRLDQARVSGVAVLLISADLDEVAALADRCCVLFQGQVVAGFERDELNRHSIGLAMCGVTRSEAASTSGAATK